MSLLLRKECQSVLDDNDLGDYHVVINKHKNYLCIVRKNGQFLVELAGINFTDNNPSAEERVYAATLLEKFLHTHNSELNAVLKARAIADKTVRPDPEGICIELHSKIYDADDASWVEATVYNKMESLSYYSKDDTFFYNIQDRAPLDVIGKLARNKMAVKDLRNAAKAGIAYMKVMDELNDAVTILRSFGI